MRSHDRANLILGMATVTLAMLIAFVWVPADVATGMIEKVRRQVTIGDALAPTLAAGFIGLGGLLVVMFERPENARGITGRNVRFLLVFLIVIALCFAIMRWLGPALTALITQEPYRLLRDEPPWKYLGFLVGGAGLIAALISFVEGRITRRALLVGLATAIGLIVIYDLPFDNLLLPPNGDV